MHSLTYIARASLRRFFFVCVHVYISTVYVYVDLISSNNFCGVSYPRYKGCPVMAREFEGGGDMASSILYEGDTVIFYCLEKCGFIYAEPPW